MNCFISIAMIKKTAFSVWQGRIAPVFDVSSTLLVRETEGPELVSEKTLHLPAETVYDRISFIAESGIGVLVCGAVSRESAVMLETLRIKCFPFIAGNIEDVIKAYSENRLSENVFIMPGCGRHGRCCGNRGNGNRPGCRQKDRL